MGSNNFIYQWRHNGIIISWETGNTLLIRNVTSNDAGMYNCTVLTQYGDNDSYSVLLIITGM